MLLPDFPACVWEKHDPGKKKKKKSNSRIQDNRFPEYLMRTLRWISIFYQPSQRRVENNPSSMWRSESAAVQREPTFLWIRLSSSGRKTQTCSPRGKRAASCSSGAFWLEFSSFIPRKTREFTIETLKNRELSCMRSCLFVLRPKLTQELAANTLRLILHGSRFSFSIIALFFLFGLFSKRWVNTISSNYPPWMVERSILKSFSRCFPLSQKQRDIFCMQDVLHSEITSQHTHTHARAHTHYTHITHTTHTHTHTQTNLLTFTFKRK